MIALEPKRNKDGKGAPSFRSEIREAGSHDRNRLLATVPECSPCRPLMPSQFITVFDIEPEALEPQQTRHTLQGQKPGSTPGKAPVDR